MRLRKKREEVADSKDELPGRNQCRRIRRGGSSIREKIQKQTGIAEDKRPATQQSTRRNGELRWEDKSVVTIESARVLLTKAREAHHSTPKAVSSPKLPSAGLCSAVPFASTNSFPLLSLFLFSWSVLEGNGIIAVHCIVVSII